MLLNTYTQGAAVALVLAAVAGLFGVPVLAGGGPLLYLGTAAIFAYVGFWKRDAALTRAVVGGLGILYLLSGAILAVSFVALEFPFDGRGFVETLGLVFFGSISTWCSRVLPCEDDPPQRY